ncbi:hypothetical protein AB0E62_34200 [Streptomyces sp. NPDC038707]|uniref:hypothetical protein n=1 Tax=Streptomyces sp. NPDC038707 TaxID=3154329 RepID=UPI0033F94933
MSVTFRQIAVSGGAAVALLGGAAAITATTPAPAAAATQHTVERAVTAPVQLPDGRTVRITGMGGYGHQATPDHVTAVSAVAYREDGSPNYTTGVAPDNGVTRLENPMNTPQQQPAGVNQQITTQAGGGAISVTVAIGIGLLIGVGYMIKRGSVKLAQAAACTALGVYLAPTFVGPLVQQLGGSVGTSLGNVWSSF